MPLEERRLRLDDGDVPGEGVDAGQREPLEPARVVGQPPLGEQARVRVDPDAQRPVRGHAREPLPEAAAGRERRRHERAFLRAACMSCSDRTPIPSPRIASMPCTTAAAACTVVMHGMPRATAADRIS